MREIPLPSSVLQRQTVLKRLAREYRACNIFFYIFTALAVLSLLGGIVLLIAEEFTGAVENTLYYALLGGLFGGTLACALIAFGLARLALSLQESHADLEERCDSHYSFYLGEGTLATFEKTELRIHGAVKGKKEIAVPYSDIRLFSVCTRTSPREKGKWCVVVEIPAHYLSSKRDPKALPILVQADAKPRLYAVIAERGLTLSGEERKEGKKKFTLVKKYPLPVPEKRRRALLFAGLGIAAAIAGGILLIWEATLGSILMAAGVLIAGRMALSFVQAKGVLALYEEGIYWKDTDLVNSVFLKWEEIETVTEESVKGAAVLKLSCAYGAYRFPAVGDSFRMIAKLHPDKTEG